MKVAKESDKLDSSRGEYSRSTSRHNQASSYLGKTNSSTRQEENQTLTGGEKAKRKGM